MSGFEAIISNIYSLEMVPFQLKSYYASHVYSRGWFLGTEAKNHHLIAPLQEKLSTIIANILVTKPPGAPYTSIG